MEASDTPEPETAAPKEPAPPPPRPPRKSDPPFEIGRDIDERKPGMFE